MGLISRVSSRTYRLRKKNTKNKKKCTNCDTPQPSHNPPFTTSYIHLNSPKFSRRNERVKKTTKLLYHQHRFIIKLFRDLQKDNTLYTPYQTTSIFSSLSTRLDFHTCSRPPNAEKKSISQRKINSFKFSTV